MHAYPLFCSILSGVLLAVNKKMTAVTFYYQCCKGNLKKRTGEKTPAHAYTIYDGRLLGVERNISSENLRQEQADLRNE